MNDENVIPGPPVEPAAPSPPPTPPPVVEMPPVAPPADAPEPAIDWAVLPDEQLLEKRIRQLNLTLAEWEPCLEQLRTELSVRGLVFHPPCFVGDEWFCPVGVPAIFIPFFLTHDRLRRLERKLILEVEGETRPWFMQLLRHEAGHAYCYAYRLHRRRRWREIFGASSSEETPGTYRPRPYSRAYVVHLPDWYAQSHPDEDFAETFAVWLTPDSNWPEHYRGWKALQKLEYVEELMRSIAGRAPAVSPAVRPQEHDCLNLKLKTYYARKRKLYEESYPDFLDDDLRRLFPMPPEPVPATKASRYLRGRRRLIMNAVCEWTGEKKYRVDQLLTRLIRRCDELALRVREGEAPLDWRLGTYVTSLVMNHQFTGRFKRRKT
jgi:hypothetical protein